MTNTSEQHTRTRTDSHTPTRRVSTETKASFKTTEFVAYLAAVLDRRDH